LYEQVALNRPEDIARINSSAGRMRRRSVQSVPLGAYAGPIAYPTGDVPHGQALSPPSHHVPESISIGEGSIPMPNNPTRRSVLAGLAAASTICLCGTEPAHAESDSPPETSRIRLPLFAKISDCQTPEYIADGLLRAEGFDDIRFVETGTGVDSSDWIAHGELDFDWNFSLAHVAQIANGVPIKVLTGLHGGCLELYAKDEIRDLPQLKGKRIGIDLMGSNGHKLLVVITSYIGFNPASDFELVVGTDAVEMFADGKIDAFFGIPPQPQIMRERKLGHALLSTAIDRPWAEYYCCMLAGHSEYVAKYPVATKRAVRALLKAVDLCATNPDEVARIATGSGRSSQYALQTISSDVRYDRWRDFDPDDTLRFYALRMQETGLIAVSPAEILERGADWRFFNELKKELKT
jgi:NitT/TauT family transport system substrate-binding protein